MELMSKKVISGLRPGQGGVPMLLKHLEPNVELICPAEAIGFVHKLLSKIKFYIRLFFLSRQHVYVIIHHHSLPWLAFIKLLLLHRIEYFSIDNSYFCMKSYNYNAKLNTVGPCRHCLQNVRPMRECKTFPATHGQFLEKISLNLLRDSISKGKTPIYSLSNSSTKLVKESLGSAVHVTTIGFTTPELKEMNSKRCDEIKDRTIVFHGNALDEKGYRYILALAAKLPNFKFIFPFEGMTEMNIIHRPCRWDSGLKHMIETAEYIAVPSLWDNTPEASSLKSLLMGKKIIYFPTSYSFESESELPLGIKLSGNIESDSDAIFKGIDIDISKNILFAQNFIKKSEIRLRNIFE